MKRHWDDAELSDGWSLSHVEFELLKNRTASTRLGFAALPKFFIFKGQFPKESEKCPQLQFNTSRNSWMFFPKHSMDTTLVTRAALAWKAFSVKSPSWNASSNSTCRMDYVDGKDDRRRFPCLDSTHLRPRKSVWLFRAGHGEAFAHRLRGIGGVKNVQKCEQLDRKIAY